jgi:hypothetical protein
MILVCNHDACRVIISYPNLLRMQPGIARRIVECVPEKNNMIVDIECMISCYFLTPFKTHDHHERSEGLQANLGQSDVERPSVGSRGAI